VSIAHSLEDFVYGIPARFGLSVATAALLLGAGYVVQVTGILLATRGRRIGFVLTFATGAGWAICLGGVCLLFRGHLPGSLPVWLEPPVSTYPLAVLVWLSLIVELAAIPLFLLVRRQTRSVNSAG